MTFRDLIPWDQSFTIPVRYRNRFNRSLSSLQDDIGQMVSSFMNDGFSGWKSELTFPAVDIIENDKDFKVKAELAGMNPEDVDVSVTDGFLTIKGEKKEEKEEKGDNYLRRESSYGSFNRTIALPDTANCEKAEATFKNGIISVSVPKKAEALQKPKKIEIKKAA